MHIKYDEMSTQDWKDFLSGLPVCYIIAIPVVYALFHLTASWWIPLMFE